MSQKRAIYLKTSRQIPSQRAHFGIFIPTPHNPSLSMQEKGTVIHAIGAPMAGYALEFKRNHVPSVPGNEPYDLHHIGEVDCEHVVDFDDGEGNEKERRDDKAICDIERVAQVVKTPGISENILAAINDTTNRRCQEWTIDFVRALVDKGYIGEEAVDAVQARRDPPMHGIGLRAVQKV